MKKHGYKGEKNFKKHLFGASWVQFKSITLLATFQLKSVRILIYKLLQSPLYPSDAVFTGIMGIVIS